MYQRTVCRLASCSLAVLVFSLDSVFLLREEGFFGVSRLSGVPSISPLHCSMAASKAMCALACLQTAACLAFSFRSGTLGCCLFPRLIMAPDVVGPSLDAHFFRIWPSCPGWKGFIRVPGTSKCVLVSDATLTWTQAADTCAMHGGHLLITENSDVMQKLQDFLPQGFYYIVGFNDVTTEGQYVWLDGTSVTRSLFHTTEPNDDLGLSTEDCGFFKVGDPDPGLHDGTCDLETRYICSLPMGL